jgi:hypothetical protein
MMAIMAAMTDDSDAFDTANNKGGGNRGRVCAEPRAALADAVPSGVRGKPRRLPRVLYCRGRLHRTGRHRKSWECPTFARVGVDGSNTSRMNLLLFVVIVTLPLYLLWFAWQVFVVIPVYVRATVRDSTIRTFHVAAFASHYGNVAVACGWALPGLLNVLAWSTEGMEGNVMGMIVLPVLLVSAVAYGVLWFASVRDALEEPVSVVVGYHIQDDERNDGAGYHKNGGGSRAALPVVS